ncbi:hypothetical protein COCOBI_14-2210 [Coccomyxa sp. Obi]|nr:hypothetical protein COCOBI_14-2210 [Coccomyxa sp. Obi]
MERYNVKNSTTLKAVAGFAIGTAIVGAAAWWCQSSKVKSKEISMSPLPDEVKEVTTTTTAATSSGEDKASHAGSEQETRQTDATPVADDGVELIEVQESGATAVNATSDVDTILTNALADSPVISWRQTSDEVILETPVDNVRGKDVTCNINAHSLYLAVLEKVLVDEPLFAPISPDDSCWEIGDAEEGRKITVSLHKANLPASQCKWKAPFASRDPAKRASKVEE